jgi:hypothetical protein
MSKQAWSSASEGHEVTRTVQNVDISPEPQRENALLESQALRERSDCNWPYAQIRYRPKSTLIPWRRQGCNRPVWPNAHECVELPDHVREPTADTSGQRIHYDPHLDLPTWPALPDAGSTGDRIVAVSNETRQ